MARALPRPLALPHLSWHSIVGIVGLSLIVAGLAAVQPRADAAIYYFADLDNLYDRSVLGTLTYVYPPALAQALEPIRWLAPFGVFLVMWIGLEVAALGWFLTPLGALVALVGWQWNIAEEIWNGNLNLLIGACIVLGFRWPAVWAFPILTKMTPGVGLLWFALRREWRSLWTGVGVTAAVGAAFFLVAPHLWLEWWAFTTSPYPSATMTPFWIRLALATAIIVYAAPRNAKWLVPIALTFALPQPGVVHWTLALAAIPLLRRQGRGPDLDVAEVGDGVGRLEHEVRDVATR